MTYYKSGNYVIAIDCDEFAENPREWGQCSEDWHIVCAEHRHYDLPHEEHSELSYEELKASPDYEVRPISFYDHSVIGLKEGAENGWDIVHCGYAWRKVGGYDQELSGVLDAWNKYANGWVLQAVLYDLDGNFLDSIGGLYDDEREALHYVVENDFDAPGFDPDKAEEVYPTYTMSFR